MADDAYSIASGADLHAGYPPPPDPEAPVIPLTFPEAATSVTSTRNWYLGGFDLVGDTTYDNDEFPFAASYSRRNSQTRGRMFVTLHSSGGYNSFVKSTYTPPTGFDFECRTQDGQAKEEDFNPSQPAEWWCYGTDGQPYPARRVAAMLDVIAARHPEFDYADEGIVFSGASMGNGGVLHTMILPDPWRARIAYCRGLVGVFMPGRVYDRSPGQYSGWPSKVSQPAIWAAVDFEALATTDAIVRGMHYRQAFSTDDLFSLGVDGTSSQLYWLKACHDNKISAVATYVRNGHSATESGITFPSITGFEVSQQDVTLDRAHPCFTNSTGNWPVDPEDITDHVAYPRGHYNLGLTWDHANIVDSTTEIIIPIQYTRRTGFGGGIPDQDTSITVDVTPRRPRNFVPVDGETLNWTFDGGAQTGTAVVADDVVTAVGISLTSGAGFKSLRFYRA